MTGKVFVDSNISIYRHDIDAGLKRQRASERLIELWRARAGRVSTQVIAGVKLVNPFL